jgi:hypothetical protein
MPKTAKPKITASELAALWDAFQDARKRWLRNVAKLSNQLDTRLVPDGLDEANAAFRAVYAAAMRAAGVKKHTKPFVISLCLSGGDKTLVGIPDEPGYKLPDGWQHLQCVPSGLEVMLED